MNNFLPSIEWLRRQFDSIDTARSGLILNIDFEATFRKAWTGIPLAPSACRTLISYIDSESNGSLNFIDFCRFWKYISRWQHHYRLVVGDRMNTIKMTELKEALISLGFLFDEYGCARLFRRCDSMKRGYLEFSDFVVLCARLQALKKNFQHVDRIGIGMITVSYKQFLEMGMNLAVW